MKTLTMKKEQTAPKVISEFDRILSTLDSFTIEALKRKSTFKTKGKTSKTRRLKRALIQLRLEIKKKLSLPVAVINAQVQNVSKALEPMYEPLSIKRIDHFAKSLFPLIALDLPVQPSLSARALQLNRLPEDIIVDNVRWECRFNKKVAAQFGQPAPNGPVIIPLLNTKAT